jgi:putative nucleotidyltransferase with HDIG domain
VTQDGVALIVSDRPDRASLLVRAVENVIACRHIDAAATLPADLPLVVVIDVTQDEATAAAWVRRFYKMRIPSLHLTNRPLLVAAKTSSAVRTLPAEAPRTVILATLFSLIEAQQAARARLPATRRAAEALVHRANTIIGDAFAAAQSGLPLSVTEVDAGTEVILDAVSDCGIRTWLEIIGRYDQQLYQHSLSVAGYAAAFGAGLSLCRADQMRLARAALLHDVGKAKIPLSILNKPGRLTVEETLVMRTHPVIGAELLARQGGFDAAMLAVVRHHHEMLDGSGYPDGLAGDAIPDLVRLVTICDIHSALTERRAYRDPLPHAEAYSIMQDMGPKLDGDLLRVFRGTVIGSVSDTSVA